jgi:serine/threonine protein kinase
MKERALRLVSGATRQRSARRTADTRADGVGSERPLGAGEVVDRYRIEQVIASGGMARVYRAVHQFTGRTVALKVMRTRYADRPDLVERFQKEAMALSQIRHSNVVAIENGGVTESGEVFIAMELLEGRTLRELLEERGRLPIREALSILSQVAQGVSAAHDVNVIHRDLKPENIFCTSDGAVKVLDLGLAKFVGHDPRETNDAIVGPIGTAAYISPERLDGMPVDVRCDIYSLGLIAYECLAGRHPMVPDGVWPSRQEIALRQLTFCPAPIPELPSGLWAAVARAIDKNPERRFSSMDEVAAELCRIRHELGETERRAVIGSRPVWSVSAAFEPTEPAESAPVGAGGSESRPASLRAYRLPGWLPWRHLAYGVVLGLLVASGVFFYERFTKSSARASSSSRPDATIAPTAGARTLPTEVPPVAKQEAQSTLPPEPYRSLGDTNLVRKRSSTSQPRRTATAPARAARPPAGSPGAPQPGSGLPDMVTGPWPSATPAAPGPSPRLEKRLPGSGLSTPTTTASKLPSSGLAGSHVPSGIPEHAARPSAAAPGASDR